MRVRFAHDMGLPGERRPTHRAPLPGFLLTPSMAAKAGRYGLLSSTSGVPCVCVVAPIGGLTPQRSQNPKRAPQCPIRRARPDSGLCHRMNATTYVRTRPIPLKNSVPRTAPEPGAARCPEAHGSRRVTKLTMFAMLSGSKLLKPAIVQPWFGLTLRMPFMPGAPPSWPYCLSRP